MKKPLFVAFVLGTFGCMGLASAEPTQLTDEQLSDVTAGRIVRPAIRISNVAIASNNVSTTGGSATATCLVGCAAVNISVLSGNIVGTITQTATATASSR